MDGRYAPSRRGGVYVNNLGDEGDERVCVAAYGGDKPAPE